MDYSVLFTKMVIFAILILIGYFMARKGILGPVFVKDASTLLVNVFVVASIFSSVLGDRPDLSNQELLGVLGLLTLYLIICYVVARIAVIPFRKEENAGQMEFLLGVSNTLFVGLPILTSLCGNEAGIYVGMSCVPYNILVYSYSVWRLKKGQGKIELKDMISPCLIAALLALLIFFLQPPVPKVFKELCSMVSGGTVPFSMIVIGASMGATNPVKAFGEKKMYYIALIRLIIAPVLVYFVLRNLTDNKVLLITCTVLAGCPDAAISTPLSIRYGYDGAEASKAIMVTTALSMITLPLLILVLF